MTDEGKVCPKCAETVRAEAKLCRHCGHTFGSDEAPVAASPSKKAGILKKGLGCLALAIVLVVVVGIQAPKSNPDGPNAGGNVAAPSSGSTEEKSGSKKGDSSAAEPGLTAANFDRIRNGMTVDQVSEILGASGEKVSETSIGGSTMTNYRWTGGMLSGHVVVGTFSDGKLYSKIQTGL